METIEQFERRKADHIRFALDPRNEPLLSNGLERIHLVHEALPDLDFDELDISTRIFDIPLASPMFVSSMTAGHQSGLKLNLRLAQACREKNWLMGVGSQRRQLFDEQARQEWREIRQKVPGVHLLGNIGIAQAIQSSSDEVGKLVDSLEAVAMIVHTNPLQEVMQPEGTPQFRGSLQALTRLAKDLPVPIIVKETGCGFSRQTLQRLNNTGIAAVDVAGFGGTHWGRVEGSRGAHGAITTASAETYKDWGINTVDSILNAKELNLDYELWASGGVRSGLDTAKLLALGTNMIGFAKPMMEAALDGTEAIIKKMNLYEYELKVALFCTGSENIESLKQTPIQVEKSPK